MRKFYNHWIYESIINRREEGAWQKLNNSAAWSGLLGADGFVWRAGPGLSMYGYAPGETVCRPI